MIRKECLRVLKRAHEGENNMRIICDHCDRQISGTVKVLAGTLNLHPDCMTELGKETKRTSTNVVWQHQENSVALVETGRHQSFDLANQ